MKISLSRRESILEKRIYLQGGFNISTSLSLKACIDWRSLWTEKIHLDSITIAQHEDCQYYHLLWLDNVFIVEEVTIQLVLSICIDAK